MYTMHHVINIPQSRCSGKREYLKHWPDGDGSAVCGFDPLSKIYGFIIQCILKLIEADLLNGIHSCLISQCINFMVFA